MYKRPLEPHDLEDIEPQQFQRDVDLKHFECDLTGWTIVDDDGTVQAVFLTPELAPGRRAAYTLFSTHLTTRALKYAAREARGFLYEWGDFRRCEAYVLEGAEHELRWCWRVLGMDFEARLRSFAYDGRACYIFAVVRE